MIGALWSRDGSIDHWVMPALAQPPHVIRAGDSFAGWASADVPHASLASLPSSSGADTPGIVCGVFGKLFGTGRLQRELAPYLPDRTQQPSAATLMAHGYQAMGRDFVAAADGELVAFVHDTARAELITRTDNIGIGRFYYALDAERYCLCTDLATLLTLFKPAGVRTQALREYFFLGYVPSPHTVYHEVGKSLPGHSQLLDARHWQFVDIGRSAGQASGQQASPVSSASTSEAENIVLAAIEESIARRLDGATSATVLLTSGYDSTLCAAILKSKCDNVRSFTIGFEERAVNENEDARKIAEHLGLEHQDLMFSVDRLLESLVEWVHAHAEPWCHPNGLPTYVAHGELRKQGGDRMVFDGSGGDYLFRDFTRIAHTIAQYGSIPAERAPRLVHALPAGLKRLIFSRQDSLPSRRVREAVQRAARAALDPADRLIFHNPWKTAEYAELTGRGFVLADTRPGREYLAGGARSLDRYLAYYRSWGFDASVGRAVMESRLQGMRATFPYEDRALVHLMENMPRWRGAAGGEMRYLQEAITKRFIPADCFASRKKAMETPLDLILRSRRGRELVEHYFAVARTRTQSLYDRTVAEAVKDRFYAGAAADALKLWSVLCFEIWREGAER